MGDAAGDAAGGTVADGVVDGAADAAGAADEPGDAPGVCSEAAADIIRTAASAPIRGNNAIISCMVPCCAYEC
jgi:hypothetical protein